MSSFPASYPHDLLSMENRNQEIGAQLISFPILLPISMVPLVSHLQVLLLSYCGYFFLQSIKERTPSLSCLSVKEISYQVSCDRSEDAKIYDCHTPLFFLGDITFLCLFCGDSDWTQAEFFFPVKIINHCINLPREVVVYPTVDTSEIQLPGC